MPQLTIANLEDTLAKITAGTHFAAYAYVETGRYKPYADATVRAAIRRGHHVHRAATSVFYVFPKEAGPFVFNDGAYSVKVGQHGVTIAKVGGAEITVPRGHAYFDRVAEANWRRAVVDLYDELAAAIA
jgi:hypothetical protein